MSEHTKAMGNTGKIEKIEKIEKTEQSIESMFDRIADKYDFINRLTSLRQDQRWRNALIRQLPQAKTGRLLDLATGTGDILLKISKLRPDFTQLTGVDLSQKMLNIAAMKLQATPAKLYKKSATQLQQLSLPAQDAITIAFGLRNIDAPQTALIQMYDNLGGGGRLLILDFFQSKSAPLFQFYFKQILPRIAGLFSDKKAYQYLPESVNSFYTCGSLKTELEAIGFRNVRIQKFLFGHCALVTADKL